MPGLPDISLVWHATASVRLNVGIPTISIANIRLPPQCYARKFLLQAVAPVANMRAATARCRGRRARLACARSTALMKTIPTAPGGPRKFGAQSSVRVAAPRARVRAVYSRHQGDASKAWPPMPARPTGTTCSADDQPGIVYHTPGAGRRAGVDDRATMHRAWRYDRSQSRVLWRIVVEGDRRAGLIA